MKIKHNDQTIEGADAAAIVKSMRAAAAFTPTRTEHEYMTQVADRAKSLSGKSVRVDSAEAFLEDLKSCGLIEVVE